MSHWNYRVVKRTTGLKPYVTTTFKIYKVYYNAKGEIACMDDVNTAAENFEELRGHVNRLMDCFGKPMLEYDDIVFGEWDDVLMGDGIEDFDGHVEGTQCC
jgi:hypothetical protein